MNKEIPTIIDLENTKDNQEQHRLLDMLVPLIEAMPSIDLIKSLNPKQNILVRMNTFIWGYLNQLVTLSAKKISIATTNQKVLLSASLSLYSIMFDNNVELSRLEYESATQAVKENKTAKNKFLQGSKACEEDFKQIGVDEPNKFCQLQNLHIFLATQYKHEKNN